MQMCWAGHPGTTEQPTCCISIAGLLLPRRFKKPAMLEGESFDFYISLFSHHGSLVAVGVESFPYFLADCMEVVEIASWESWFLMAVIESDPKILGVFAT